MDPALMFGMLNDEEEEEDYTQDLSGWMSRSPPSLGDIPEPMINEPQFTSRPRGGGASDPVATTAAMAAGPEPQFTSRPRSNPRDLGYTLGPGDRFQTPLNPLYAHDEALVSPKLVAGVKTGAVVALAASALWNKGLPGRRLGTVATLAYLHPVIGWKHGYWDQYLDASGILGYASTAGKVLVHGGALYAGFKFMTK